MQPPGRVQCSTIFCNSKNVRDLRLSPDCLSATRDDATWDWAQPNDLLCLQCGHGFENTPVYIPAERTEVSPDLSTYAVYGNFCSFACAKRELFQKEGVMGNTKQLRLLQCLANDVYGIKAQIFAAPHRCELKAYGGGLEIQDYRAISEGPEQRTFRPGQFSSYVSCIERWPKSKPKEEFKWEWGDQEAQSETTSVLDEMITKHADDAEAGLADRIRDGGV